MQTPRLWPPCSSERRGPACWRGCACVAACPTSLRPCQDRALVWLPGFAASPREDRAPSGPHHSPQVPLCVCAARAAAAGAAPRSGKRPPRLCGLRQPGGARRSAGAGTPRGLRAVHAVQGGGTRGAGEAGWSPPRTPSGPRLPPTTHTNGRAADARAALPRPLHQGAAAARRAPAGPRAAAGTAARAGGRPPRLGPRLLPPASWHVRRGG